MLSKERDKEAHAPHVLTRRRHPAPPQIATVLVRRGHDAGRREARTWLLRHLAAQRPWLEHGMAFGKALPSMTMAQAPWH